MTVTQRRLINPDGRTTCCHAFTTIGIDDSVEYCKTCYLPTEGRTSVDLSHNTRVRILSTVAADDQPANVYEYPALTEGRYQVFVGDWRVASLKTRDGALRRAELEEGR